MKITQNQVKIAKIGSNEEIKGAEILNQSDFIGTWETMPEDTELIIYENGIFVIDHYTISSEVRGDFEIDGENIVFVSYNGKTWNGKLTKEESGTKILKVILDGDEISFYNSGEANSSNKYNENISTTKTTQNVSTSEFAKTWETIPEDTELIIYENGTFVTDHYTTASEVRGKYEIYENNIEFVTEDGSQWKGQLVIEDTGRKVLKVTLDGNETMFYAREKKQKKNSNDFVRKWETVPEDTELIIYENGIFITDHYTAASEVRGKYEINGSDIKFINEDGKSWSAQLIIEGTGRKILKAILDGSEIIFYDLTENN